MNCFMIWLKNDERDGALLSLEFGNRSDDRWCLLHIFIKFLGKLLSLPEWNFG